MNSIPLYQHPFVDIFKSFQLTQWKQAEKSGDVTEVVDKAIGKKAIQLIGPSNTASFIQLPRSKSKLKSLGLIGKYVKSRYHLNRFILKLLEVEIALLHFILII